jgi:hypothetical protein
MLKTLIAITAIALIVSITIWIVRRLCARCDARSQRQFPTAYTLLKSSPLIIQREIWALRVIAVLSLVFLLLLLTSLF